LLATGKISLADTEKVLVIGSTGHQHVKCVEWQNVETVNLVDFDAVVVNVRSLNANLCKRLSLKGANIRASLARLLNSGGHLVVLGDKAIRVDVGPNDIDNYFWSPLSVGIMNEAGDTIDIRTEEYPGYLSKLKGWQFYYFFPTGCLTSEMKEVCGKTERGTTYHPMQFSFAENRYRKMLSGAVLFQIIRNIGPAIRTGRFILLPLLEDVDDRQAVNLALVDMLKLPQETLPPEWVSTVVVPGLEDIQSGISEKKTGIAALEQQIAADLEEIGKLEEFKKLLYVSGHELEDIFEACLVKCGGTIKEARYSDEEFVLEHRGGIYLIECKGVGKSIARGHVDQLLGYLTLFEEKEGKDGKGILLGNAWKDLPIDQRGQNQTTLFPPNVIRLATANDIALVSSVAFFQVFCRFLAGEVSGDAILDRITSTVGIVTFEDL
jgi:hypothetical protein